jgi:hypothetical protein
LSAKPLLLSLLAPLSFGGRGKSEPREDGGRGEKIFTRPLDSRYIVRYNQSSSRDDYRFTGKPVLEEGLRTPEKRKGIRSVWR